MSNQIDITGGARVRGLNGVITGTTGVLDSLPINSPNGIPQLDINGKILVSQLPNSVMEFLGTWNAATNTPTLADGIGNAGDVYLCNVAGTVNFGSGPIVFNEGDYVVYSGLTWERSGGALGTVTSVAASINGNAVGITGSPITTAGTLAFGFTGTDFQYINGGGNLTTFPTLITSIGLSMPTAFNVSNSPLTANGTIAVTGAGTASQYIRGDGQLATFPTTGGGGSAIYYYLNGSIDSTVTGYKQLSNTAIVGAGTDFALSGNGLIAQFLTDVGNPNRNLIPSGAWNFEVFFSSSSNGGNEKFYLELVKYNGSTFTTIASTVTNPEAITGGTTTDLYITSMAVPETTLLVTDRLAVRVYIVDNSGARTVTLHTENGNLCQITTTFSAGISSLNGLTANTQYFAVGTAGSDFNINSLIDTHTFNLPSASATARGVITTGTQTIAGIKTFTSNINADAGIGIKHGTTVSQTGYTGLGANVNQLLIGLTGAMQTMQYPTAANYTYTFPSATGTLALTTDLTNAISGTTNYIPKFTTANTIGNSLIYDNGTNVGIGTTTAPRKFTVNGSALFGSTTNPQPGGSTHIVDIVATGGNSPLCLIAGSGNLELWNNINVTRAVAIGMATPGAAMTDNFYISLFNGATWDTRLFINNSTGNIGIGTTTDAGYKLDVNGTARVSGNVGIGGSTTEIAGYTSLTISNSSSGSFLDLNNSGVNNLRFLSLSSIDQRIQAQGNLRFDTGGTPRLTIASTGAATFSGNVGIGITPITKLHLQGSSPNYILLTNTAADGVANAIQGGIIGQSRGYSNNLSQMASILFRNDPTNWFRGEITFNTNGTDGTDPSILPAERMRINSSGNVGIGTSSPANKLTIAGSSGTIMSLSNGADADLLMNFTSGVSLLTPTTGILAFGTGSTERMRITLSGNLLVGTTTDAGARLQVSGNTSISNGLSIGTTYNPGNNVIISALVISNNAGSYPLKWNSSNGIVSFDGSSRLGKQDIVNSPYGLAEIMKLTSRKYFRIDDKREEIGLIADEVQSVMPEFVPMVPKSLFTKISQDTELIPGGVNYDKLTSVLIKAIQEQQSQIEELKALINK